MSEDMFPCKPIPLSEKGKEEYDRIFGHGEYDQSKHSDTWNNALRCCVEKGVAVVSVNSDGEPIMIDYKDMLTTENIGRG